jgi:hypothetical protein
MFRRLGNERKIEPDPFNPFNPLNKLLASENLTEQERDNSIKAISAATVVINIIGFFKTGGDSAVAATLGGVLIGLLSQIFSLVAGLFEYVRTLPDRITPDA